MTPAGTTGLGITERSEPEETPESGKLLEASADSGGREEEPGMTPAGATELGMTPEAPSVYTRSTRITGRSSDSATAATVR